MAAGSGASLAAMRPETDDEAIDRLLHPGRHYERPADVLADTALTPSEQRAILSSWAAGACAAAGAIAPDLPPSGPPVSFDEVLDALAQLDRAGGRGARPVKAT